MQPLKDDPQLRPLLDAHGELELTVADDPFARLIRSIVGQQLSVASARAIHGRLFDRFEVAPEPLLAADPEALRDLGLSRQKVDYTKSAAQAFLDRDLTPAAFAAMDDAAVIDTLTEIHGVGVWTAKMFLMFALGRPDVFPVEDLGIRKGMKALYDADSRDAMRAHAERWRPFRSHASLYLWRAADAPPDLTE